MGRRLRAALPRRTPLRLPLFLPLCLLLPLLIAGADTARAVPGDDPSGSGRVRPVPGDVGRGWEPPPERWSAGHRGVDLAARPGEPVRAVAAGRVSFAGKVAGRGVVSVELAGTGSPPLRTTYEPVGARVREGDRVAAGDVVGVLEADGFHCPVGCLHWGLRRGDVYLDPLSLLDRGPSRLLPVLGVPLPEEGETESKRGDVMRTAAAQGSLSAGSPGAGTALVLAVAAFWARRRHIRFRAEALSGGTRHPATGQAGRAGRREGLSPRLHGAPSTRRPA
ncbi:M23 family metallopeptidase [Streptomyces verrucosisporus]|uniref:murein hydrolase activator EnvC family protein n=1 Tax=Streptomyces verrucosisporus TaxID=1695161 RepID=UPI0019D222BD|nr:M23 family metallopeptidase [Streptomyces verrucosisporus]